jgi:hypothetical protein
MVRIGPFRGIRFDRPQHFRDCNVRAELGENMYMVGDSADLDLRTFVFANDSPDVFMKLLTKEAGDQRLPKFRGVDDVIDQIREGAGHHRPCVSWGSCPSIWANFDPSANTS